MNMQSRFYSRPVTYDVAVDLSAMPVYRMKQFPENAGPLPWLDLPDAMAQIDLRLDAGEISAEEADLCRKWSRDGYIILKNFYSDTLLDKTWADYEQALHEGKVTAPDEAFYDGDTLPGRVLNAHFSVKAMDDMLFEPRMSHIVSVLFGAKARPFQTIVGHKSSQQLEHSDSIHMSTYPHGYLAANWIAYEDVHADSGPLIYYPGSHKLPYLLAEELNISDYAEYAATYEPAIQDQIRRYDLKPQIFLPQKGDVLLWHANLLHGGTKVSNLHLTRKALVCHFFAEGCICYHDLTGTLAHTQMAADLYTYASDNRPKPAQPVAIPAPLFEKIAFVYRTGGLTGLLKRALSFRQTP